MKKESNNQHTYNLLHWWLSAGYRMHTGRLVSSRSGYGRQDVLHAGGKESHGWDIILTIIVTTIFWLANENLE
eukprot:scaffold7908_cov46-Attheya_sp.AAC.2